MRKQTIRNRCGACWRTFVACAFMLLATYMLPQVASAQSFSPQGQVTVAPIATITSLGFTNVASISASLNENAQVIAGNAIAAFPAFISGAIDDPADLNHDGAVNVGDVTTLVNMILGKAPQVAAADLNHDGAVNVGDVTTLVNLILGK